MQQTKPAHRVIEKAYEVGGWELQSQVVEKLYEAFHVEGLDVCDPEILAKTASSVDGFLSYEEALKFVQGDDLAYEVDKALEKGVVWGVESVPFFILDGRLICCVSVACADHRDLQKPTPSARQSSQRSGTRPLTY